MSQTNVGVSPSDVEAAISSQHYFTGSQAAACGYNIGNGGAESLHLLSFCILVLRNGFTVVGQATCIGPAEFDLFRGRFLARQDAMSKVYQLLGYVLKTELARPVLTEADTAADLAGTPRPDRSANATATVASQDC